MRNFAPMKCRKTYLVTVLLLCLVGSAAAQWLQPAPGHRRAVYGTDYYVSPSALDYSATARSIVGDASTRYDKAQRLYLWIAANISFDRSGRLRTADEAFRHRKAVCQGYCELFYRLGECVGLKPRLVYGKSRRPSAFNPHGTLEDHVWLSVMTEEGSILIDPTWGAGYYRGDEFVRQAEPLRWFDVDPAWFIFTHLPKNDQRQLLTPAVTDEQFARLTFVAPPAHPDVAEDAHKALQRALGIGVEPADCDSVATAAAPEDSIAR